MTRRTLSRSRRGVREVLAVLLTSSIALTGCSATPSPAPRGTGSPSGSATGAPPPTASPAEASAAITRTADERRTRVPDPSPLPSEAATGLSLDGVTVRLLDALAADVARGDIDTTDGLAYARAIAERADAGLDPTTGAAFRPDGADPIPTTTRPVPLERHEAFVSDFVAEPDAAGSFLPAIAELAAATGLRLVQSDPRRVGPCDEGGPSARIGYYATQCGPVRAEIWINRGRDTYAELALSPDVASVMRHEIAHYELFLRCAAHGEYEGGADIEAVTSSYAVLFLGADRTVLDATADDAGREHYRTSAASDHAARVAHETPPSREPRCG